MSWADVEFLMAYWYREGAGDAWGNLAELEVDAEALASVEHLFTTPEDRAIHADMREDVIDQRAFAAEELRPQLRLATTDRRSHKYLRS